MGKLSVTWRKAIRQVWKLPYRTHCCVIRGLTSGLCDIHMFISRCLKFILNAVNANTNVISLLFRLSLETPGTILARNMSYCMKNLCVNMNSLQREDVTFLVRRKCTDECRPDIYTSRAVIDICNQRDGMAECGPFTNEETITFISVRYMCCLYK